MNFVFKIYEKTWQNDKNKDQHVGEKTDYFLFGDDTALSLAYKDSEQKVCSQNRTEKK